MSESHIDPQNDGPLISEDFLQGDVREGLARMRKRLLDLTARNRLLNFPQRPSKTSLRTVDELPDNLFSHLVGGRALLFKPVPRPRGLRAPSDDLQEAEQTHLDGVVPNGLRYPTAKETAEGLGLETSFDLPAPGAGPGGNRHTDQAIQTLHYPNDLEGILLKISSAARLAIEETGSNMLYLIFGFLEWYESEDSDQPRFAPLLLLPVTLEKGKVDASGTTQYSVRHSGEDVQTNVSLQERLKRDFGLSIPSLSEDDTPETYFAKLTSVTARFSRWRVRRQITLSLLSFGKILMYKDLDPETWPKGASPADHDRITDLFRGIQRDSITFAEDYALDDRSTTQEPPMLVDEADSSQHSALIDAMAGKNMVIEGPPGTGKSQTITNLIASALAAGKTVLFISDKLAALTVVRDRLDKVGLGMFCLELHSHKSQKRQILDDVEQRLRAYGSFRDPSQLDAKLSSLAADKTLLSSYVSLINRPYGALGRTLYDIVWSARRQRAGLPFPPELIEGISISRASDITLPLFADYQQEAVQFSTHLRNVLGTAESIRTHPWFGVRNAELTFSDEAGLTVLLESWVHSCDELVEHVRRTNDTAGIALLGDSRSTLEKLVEGARALPAEAGDVVAGLLPALKRRDLRARLSDFMRWVAQYRRTVEAISQLVGTVPTLTDSETVEATRLASRSQELLPKATQVHDVSAGATICLSAASAVERARAALDKLNGTLQVELPLNHAGVDVALATLAAIQACPVDALHLRHQGLDVPGAQALLESLGRDAAAIRAQRETLRRRLDLSFAPPLPELRAHVTATANPRWWSFLFRDYRAARRAYRVMARDGRSASSVEMREALRRLHDYAAADQRLCTNEPAKALVGSAFAGINSPYDALAHVTAWRAQLGQRLAPFGPSSSTLTSSLWTSPTDRLRSVHESGPSTADLLQHGLDALASTSALALEPPPSDGMSLGDIGTRVEHLGRELSTLADGMTALGLPATLALQHVPELGRLLTEMRSLEQLIGSTTEVRDALQSDFRGTTTDLDRLTRTIELYDRVASAPVPHAIVDWLLDGRVESRLAHAHQSIPLVVGKLGELDSRWQAFASLSGADAAAWFGTERSEELSLDDRIGRARRALASREDLAGWLDYLRAREPLVGRGFDELIRLAELGRIGADSVGAGVAFIVFNSLVREAFAAHPQLTRFSGLSHDEVRRRFAKYDRECIALYRQRAARLIDARTVPAGIGSGSVRTFTERHLLDHEISKQKAHVPLRQLMFRAGRALQSLKPCFMMGPLSVAQYLTPGALKFDLIVMDEASQLRPEDALGAISRGTQLVIVGDRMQLPPTSFFDRIGDDADESDENAGAVTEAESILDIASATYKPSRMLRWHYRSRHGSLIAFSNQEFYKGRLVVFPSPVPISATHGVKLIHVRDGAYERSRNITEARRVVSTAVRFMERSPTESLGIVAMNVAQRELIEDLFEAAVKRSDTAQRYVDERRDGLEPFFVKNLENVQGDERDVIYISNTYGRSPGGQVYQRFGPINGPSGHQRLNVLFTRARNRVVLFSSMLAEDIIAEPSSSWGVRAFKGYLHFAQTGILETASFSGREPDSDFEVEVADALRGRGYEVVAQVGVAGYFIDLAIRHPGKPDAFLLGIECDGATYHSGLSARDRDRLRQQVLEGLGWNIHRIWSTDWFKQPKVEVDRVVSRIKIILQAEAASTTVFSETESADSETAPEVAAGSGATESAWEGEVAAQPMSEGEAREELARLAAEAREMFSTEPVDAFVLRPEMIDALIRTRPVSKEDWLRKVPFDLRMVTDGNQLGAFLPRILAITARLGS